jgi:SNF2 family DNA or RNA helicase
MSLRRRKGRVKGLRYKFKTQPYRHQVKALKKLLFRAGGALFCEMGTGKTKIALDFCGAMHIKRKVTRVVICCPKSVISVWRLEIKKHVPDHIRDKIRFVIINYEQLPDIERKGDLYKGRVHVLEKFLEGQPSILILDESHLIKKPSAKRSKCAYKLSKSADMKLLLTGTKLTKDVLDLYHQFKCLDERIFGTNFAHFKRRYCVFGGYGNYKLLRYINLHELKEKAKPWVFQAKLDDCLDLPARTDQVVPIRLTGETKRIYQEMLTEGLAVMDGEEFEADIILTKILRLQQISSGYLKDEDDELHFFGDDKRRQLEADVKEFAEQEINKFVVFAQFIPDLKVCAEVVKAAGYKPILFHGKVSNTQREMRLCEFDETDEKVAFVSQNDAGSMGISLTAAQHAIHYSHTRKYSSDRQLKGRLRRIGQHHPTIHRHYVAGGIDQLIMIANKTKKNTDDWVLSRPALLMEAGYQLK